MRRTASLIAALSAAVVLQTAAPASSGGTRACGESGYSYAGVARLYGRYGVSSRLTALATPYVMSGHVAAWVGVGGAGMGPSGSDEWLQAGFVAYTSKSVHLYYELKRPAAPAQLVLLDTNVKIGQSHRVAVLESHSRPGFWRVWVDGRRVTRRIFLPHSHGAWLPVATTESWDGGQPACNSFDFRFDGLRVATSEGGGWKQPNTGVTLEDPGYRVVREAPAAFMAGRA